MGEKHERGRVYQFTPRRGPKLKAVNYVSPEKRELLKRREQAKRDRRNFYKGLWILLAVIVLLSFLRLR
ncbi:MAG: hypothetical protein K6T29_04410 [Peptococcaceae bacterium]|nr:hypothetical protein [Peptococcaceae bacterium]